MSKNLTKGISNEECHKAFIKPPHFFVKVISAGKIFQIYVSFNEVVQAKSHEIDERDWWHYVLKGPVHSAKRNINHIISSISFNNNLYESH